MTPADRILTGVVVWANTDPNVRGLVLVGSRARSQMADELSDIDVQVYAISHERYTRDEAWLSQFAPVWVCVCDEYVENNVRVPTRLVIFDQGVKVDFAFYSAAMMTGLSSDGRPRQVLLDKDRVVEGTGRELSGEMPPELPAVEEFGRVVKEFWFEAYHVAKYLSRGDLWLAKSRDYAAKQLLLRIVEWHALAELKWNQGVDDEGKNMQSWVSADVWEDLHSAFARFDAADSWRALIRTNKLFRRLAVETAQALGFEYPSEVDRNISEFIGKLERQAGFETEERRS